MGLIDMYQADYLFFRSICTTFELTLEDRLHLGNENKSRFILHFARFALPLHPWK